MNMVLIPTLNPTFSLKDISSIHSLLRQNKDNLAVIVYNSSDKAVTTEFHENAVRIGTREAQELVTGFSKLADCREELLFGQADYGRSYGGASNLLMAIALSLNCSNILKMDDDLAIAKKSLNSNLLPTTNSHIVKAVQWGSYVSRSSLFFRKELASIRDDLIKMTHRDEFDNKIAEVEDNHSNVIRNGILLFPSSIAREACYPVLFESITKTKVRGEMFFWREDLLRCGIKFVRNSELDLPHYFKGGIPLTEWLKSIIIGADLHLVRRYRRIGRGNMPSCAERYEYVNNLYSIIQKLDLIEDNDSFKNMDFWIRSIPFEFTERILSEEKLRNKAWKCLVASLRTK